MDKDVVVYVSSDCTASSTVLRQLDEWNVPYQKKNVSENQDTMKELQSMGIFGTPATFVGNVTILGLQLNKLKRTLGV
ncbi:glutaredoxin family protein [Lentibacillus saliphilus]|uniref:glutaredoxin family protein n=1 Tax=Lentibacillus saliphilus TaxID=2737028 RepID=UPI001C310E42|nr:glutaredoxin domain-containing protein [Lentibacillus saliphilus]